MPGFIQSRKFALILATSLAVTLTAALYLSSTKPKQTIILPNITKIQVEIADTGLKRSKGLMHRKTLPQNQGMLFIFDDSAKHIFWMKNTLIPLDMVWLDENLRVVDISHNIPPCVTPSCQTYMPANPAKYVLEINGGLSERNNLKTGDQITRQQN